MNRKLVLMPTVLATAVMVGCNSDSGDDKDYQPSLVDLNIEVTNLDRVAEGYWLAVAYPVQTIVTAEYSDGSVKDVTGSESLEWDMTDELGKATDGTVPGQFLAFHPGSGELTATYGGQSVQTVFTIADEKVDTIVVDGPSITLVGLATPYNAEAIFSQNRTIDLTEFVEWNVDVDADTSLQSKIVFEAAVPASMTATYDFANESSDEFSVDVIDGTSEDDLSLSISGSNTIMVDSFTQLTAEIDLSNGKDTASFDVTESASWLSSCSQIAVSATGFVSANAEVNYCEITSTFLVDGIDHTDTHVMRAVDAMVENVVVECPDTYFYGEMQCSAYLTYVGSDIKEDVTETADWYPTRSVSEGVVKSEEPGAEIGIQAYHSGRYSEVVDTIVGIPAGRIRIEAAYGQENAIYVDGKRELVAKVGDVDVTNAVKWSVEPVIGSEAANWNVTDSGVVTVARNQDIISYEAIITATNPADGEDFTKYQIEVVSIPLCQDDSIGECLKINQDLGGTSFVATPHVNIIEALNAEYSGSVYHDKVLQADFAKLNFKDAENWCSLLNYHQINGQSWAVPVLKEMQSIFESVEDVETLGWAVNNDGNAFNSLYWTSQVDTTDARKMVTIDPNAPRRGEGNSKEQNLYTACVSR